VRDARATKHFLTVSLERDGAWFDLARYFDVDYDRRGPRQLAEFLGLAITDVFPITYDLSDIAVGSLDTLKGCISQEPDGRLSEDDLIELTLQADEDEGDEGQYSREPQLEGVDEPSDWRIARMKAMENVLGKADDVVGHAVIPFQMGSKMGGAMDVVCFRKHLDGVVCVTSGLIGCDDQKRNRLGNYELMICHRTDDRDTQEWGSGIISRLAYYTCDVQLNPGDTMDVGPGTPEASTIRGLLFCEYASFNLEKHKAGLLLAVGITGTELNACRDGKREEVVTRLKASGVYPFTDLFRKSVF
jgi:hypothetical protein